MAALSTAAHTSSLPSPQRRKCRHPQRNHARRGGASSSSVVAGSVALSSSSEVYVAAIPLVGLEAIGALLGDRYPDRLEHTMVLVRHRGGDGDGGAKTTQQQKEVTAYDFLPIDPMNPLTAATLASGGCVPGDLRVRTLRGLPSRRCWKVGDTVPGLGLDKPPGLDAQDARRRPQTTTGAGVGTPYNSGSETAGTRRGYDENRDDDDDEAGRRGVDAACLRFQREYDASLSLAGNSCREHTVAMAAFLTGVQDVEMPENIFS